MQTLFTRNEAEHILATALMHQSAIETETVDIQVLTMIAERIGIEAPAVQYAITQAQEEHHKERLRREWKQLQRAQFGKHAVLYAIANAFFMLMNVTASGRIQWALLPLLGWGLGLAIHGANSFFPTDLEIEKGSERLQAKRVKQRKTHDESLHT
jgi:hypothetical protein